MLEEIGAADIPRITIWNKLDLVQEPDMVGGQHQYAITSANSSKGQGHIPLWHCRCGK